MQGCFGDQVKQPPSISPKGFPSTPPPASPSFPDNQVRLGGKARVGGGTEESGGGGLKKKKRNHSGHNPRAVHLRVSYSRGGILMNNGPSWQTVQGCGASLKKQQITQAPGPPGRGPVRSWKAGPPPSRRHLGNGGSHGSGGTLADLGSSPRPPLPSRLSGLPVCSDPTKALCGFSGPCPGMPKAEHLLAAVACRGHRAT